MIILAPFSKCFGHTEGKVRGAYVYFSDNPDTYKQQIRSRTTQPAEEVLSEADAVVILCALIKHHGQTIFTSSQLRSIAPFMGTYGFDVIEYTGMKLFVHSRNEKEIMKSLRSRNIFVSERQIGYLGQKFIVYLALAHGQSREKLVHSISKGGGGYILHVDGTCDGNSPHLFCGIDGISELVLENINIPSEKKDLLIPFFQRIKKYYWFYRILWFNKRLRTRRKYF